MGVSILRGIVLAMSVVAASCSSAQDNCRNLGLQAGYHTVTLQLSWSGISTDQPNFTKADCDVPLQDVIIPYDTRDRLGKRLIDKKLTMGRSSFEEKISAFVYQTQGSSDSKVFIVGMDFDDTKPRQ